MAFKPRKNCKICQAVKANPKLAQRMFATSYYTGKGRDKESLALIAEKEGMSYPSVLNHCKYHQAPTEDDLSNAQVNRVVKANTNKHIQKALTTRDKRAALIDKMFDKLEAGEFDDKMTVKDLITTLKHADDVDAKAKDQGIDILKMMQGSRAGAPTNTQPIQYEQFDPWNVEQSENVEEADIVPQ